MIRILFDAFHHMMPGHRIGPNIVTGGYQTNVGRYSPGDCFHPNGLSFVHADLADRYDIRLLNAPFSEMSLFDADILFVANPDYPLYEQASPHRLTPEDVDALMKFLQRGGGVLLLVNSFLSRPDFWEENFDLERVGLLFERLGIRWDPNFMSEINNLEVARSGPRRIGYGQGGRVWKGALARGIKPLLRRDRNIYGFETRVGQGTLVVLGDAGLASNGLACFPGYDNAAFVKSVFDQISPRWSRGRIRAWDCLRFAHMSCAPSQRGLSEELFRRLRPQAQWKEDYHYRHLTWDQRATSCRGAEAWTRVPVNISQLAKTAKARVRLNWLQLDRDAPGPAFTVDLKVNAQHTHGATDLHAIGRAHSRTIRWRDLCANPESMRRAGEIEQLHGVFELKAVLDARGRGKSVRWSQGQILYARNPSAVKYGYEIVLNSSSGIIVPQGR